MGRPFKSVASLHRRVRAECDHEYRAELERLKDIRQIRKGRFGGLVRALRAGQDVDPAKVAHAVAEAWVPPADVLGVVRKITNQPLKAAQPARSSRDGESLVEVALRLGWKEPIDTSSSGWDAIKG